MDAEVIEVSTPQLEDVVRLEDRYGRVGDAAPETRREANRPAAAQDSATCFGGSGLIQTATWDFRASSG